MARKRKKLVRYRGSKTHGCGSMKKRRGAGNRGGRGNAGSGKKADGKKPSFWGGLNKGRNPDHMGFTSPTAITYETINIGHLSSIAETLVKHGQALRQGDSIVINMRELGIEKLLGSGKVSHKLKIGVQMASPKAKEKVEQAGGSLDADLIVDKETVIAERDERAKARKNAGKKHAPVAKAAEPAAE